MADLPVRSCGSMLSTCTGCGLRRIRAGAIPADPGERRTGYGRGRHDWTATQLSDTGSITLDLSQAPADALKTIRLDDIGGDVTIVMRQNQPVGFHLYSSVGLIRSDYWLDAQGGRVSSPWIPEVQFVSEELAFRNDFWSPEHGINLEITNVYGSVTIIESAPADISGDTIQSGDLSQSGAQSGDTAQSSSRSNG